MTDSADDKDYRNMLHREHVRNMGYAVELPSQTPGDACHPELTEWRDYKLFRIREHRLRREFLDLAPRCTPALWYAEDAIEDTDLHRFYQEM